MGSLTSDLFTHDKLSETIVYIPVAPIAFSSSTKENKNASALPIRIGYTF